MSEKNIFQRLAAISAELGVVAKNLTVEVSKTRSYSAVSERDIIDAVKPLEEKHGVFSYPVSRDIVETETLTRTTEHQGKTTESNSLYMRVATTYRFVNVDNPEDYVETMVYADGIDTGDKAPGKAMTYADKYALMKVYKISTGDDPDADASPVNGYKKASSKKASETQIKFLAARYTADKLTDLLQKKGVKSLEDLPIEVASDLIKRIKEYEERNGKE